MEKKDLPIMARGFTVCKRDQRRMDRAVLARLTR